MKYFFLAALLASATSAFASIKNNTVTCELQNRGNQILDTTTATVYPLSVGSLNALSGDKIELTAWLTDQDDGSLGVNIWFNGQSVAGGAVPLTINVRPGLIVYCY